MSKTPINKGLTEISVLKYSFSLIFFLLFFLISPSLKAESEPAHKEKFQPGKMIMSHVKDAYDWHIMDINGKAISIPLPVIVYHPERGFDMFLSSKFHHGHEPYKGYHLVYKENQFRYVLESVDGSSFYNFSLTKNNTSIVMVSIIIMLIFFSVAKAYKRREGMAPKGFQSLIEPIILFVRDEIAKPSVGKKYETFLPFLLTIFFFIWINNLFGIIPFFPGGANVTGNISITFVLALFTLVITIFSGNKVYWKHILLPDVPIWMYPILIPIEIMGIFLKPFVLMLRLFANILAEHIIALGFFSLIFIFGETSKAVGMSVGVFSVLFTVFMGLLSILVTFIQAYVFTLLSALYFGMATEEHH
ncbi:MAG: F0F1 ATP synthase subunit A [Bacteroidetes bacterium]|nr:F0F1 ATP synthase subunit A [Bacteroidota bacterium]